MCYIRLFWITGDNVSKNRFIRTETGAARASTRHERGSHDAGTETTTEGITFSGSSVCVEKKGNINYGEKCPFQEKCQTEAEAEDAELVRSLHPDDSWDSPGYSKGGIHRQRVIRISDDVTLNSNFLCSLNLKIIIKKSCRLYYKIYIDRTIMEYFIRKWHCIKMQFSISRNILSQISVTVYIKMILDVFNKIKGFYFYQSSTQWYTASRLIWLVHAPSCNATTIHILLNKNLRYGT